MADSLKDLYNADASMWTALSDPFTIKRPASQVAYNTYGEREESSGKGDALRHLLGAATLAKRQGAAFAQTALNWHENPNIPNFLGGGYGQRPVDREMDLHNNLLGLEIAKKAKTYDEALNLAKQYVNTGKVKTTTPAQEEKKSSAIPEHDLNPTFQQWLSKYMSK